MRVRTHNWRGEKITIEVAEYVAHKLTDDSCENRGELEGMRRQLDLQASMIGALAQRLVKSKEDLADLGVFIGWDEEVVE